jgi:Na+/H+ antiporter NhaD/arsenite permease-like protein
MQSTQPSFALQLAGALPFVALLLSIALLPALAPRFWVRRMGWVALGWTLALLLPMAAIQGPAVAWHMAWHAILIEYLPFVALLGALYVASGGVLVRGGPAGTPAGNTAMLAIGMLLGVVMGTTGSAMVMIHPLLRGNAHRRRKVHLVLFLIVLVANASGLLTPLGNPPLFVGYLRGVPFLWPARALLAPYLFFAVVLLGVFWVLDRYLSAWEPPAPPRAKLRVRGWGNLLLVLALGVSVLQQSMALPSVTLLGVSVGTGRLAGIAVAAAIAALSLLITPRAVRQANDFSWHPMAEVAILFAGIFVTLAPVSAMLQQGADGPMAAMLRLTQDDGGRSNPLAYFWLAGVLSAFLDNAPTYLVFFDLAGIRPDHLTRHAEVTLAAISAGAVLFGGLTYIGSAPNLMLRAIASHRGVRMPGFFGYLGVAALLLLPVFAVLGVVFFL